MTKDIGSIFRWLKYLMRRLILSTAEESQDKGSFWCGVPHGSPAIVLSIFLGTSIWIKTACNYGLHLRMIGKSVIKIFCPLYMHSFFVWKSIIKELLKFFHPLYYVLIFFTWKGIIEVLLFSVLCTHIFMWFAAADMAS